MSATLLVTIDTEEEFDWDAPVSPENNSVGHADHLPRLQELFEEEGVRPTYVVDYPIATTDDSARVLGQFVGRGACEIGAHVHPWVNPPIDEPIEPRNSYLCNLPQSLQEEKIGRLTEAIETAFGIRPTTFKAGRYGLDFRTVPFLQSLGYTVDTSVIAYMDLRADEGPNYLGFGNEPFRLTPPLVPASNGHVPLLEVPCSVGFTRRPFDRWSRTHHRLSHDRFRRYRPIGLLWHSHLLRKIVLTPEGTHVKDQLRLLRTMAKAPDVVLNVTLHSPSIQPGNTPYVRNEDELEQFLSRLRDTLRFAVRQLGARCMTMSEYADSFERAVN